MNDDLWLRSYIKLTHFLKDNGHYPNIKSQDENEKMLAKFVREQRDEYKNNIIKPYREKLLNNIHFYWCYDKVKNDNSLTTWQNYQERYIQKMINTNGSKFSSDGKYKTNKTLQWQKQQMKDEKNGSINPDREYELNKIGFDFIDHTIPKSQRKTEWFKNYNLLIELLKSVAGDYDKIKTLPKFKSIEKWFETQIKEEQTGALEDDRQYLLENINFPFESIYKKD